MRHPVRLPSPLAGRACRAACTAALLVCVCGRAPAADISCSISVSGVAFGAYDVQSRTPLDSVGNITLICINGTPAYTISISTGGSGSYAPRVMTGSTGDRLSYNLYTDPACTSVWGDGVSSGTSTVKGNKNSVNYVIYGRVPAGQKVSSGNYGDLVTVTVMH